MSEDKGGGERYAVSSISGYSIIPDFHSIDTNGKWRTIWYVVDKAYCCNVVAEFKGQRAEERARKRCHHLNTLERRWEVTGW